jgi:hypothetical protein
MATHDSAPPAQTVDARNNAARLLEICTRDASAQEHFVQGGYLGKATAVLSEGQASLYVQKQLANVLVNLANNGACSVVRFTKGSGAI